MGKALDLSLISSSAFIRLGAYIFLRWIPGHHFPPTILTAAAVYFTLIFAYSSSFGPDKPTLRTAFPRLFKHEKPEIQQTEATSSLHDRYDEPPFYSDEKIAFRTLLLGIPDWRDKDFSYITIAINILLTLCSLDMVFRGPLLHSGHDLRFSRVGFVDAHTAKVLFREPDPKNLPVYVYQKRADQSRWTNADVVYWLSDDTDFTYPVTFSGLEPETAYTYSLSNHLSGTFTTASDQSSPKAGSLTFLTSSCIKANFPYSPLSHSLEIPGFKYLSKTIRSLPALPSFMLFLGDFIYVDVPLRLSSSLAHYRAEYRRVYASPSWRMPGLSIPWLHTLDDHEIENDWAKGNDTEPFPAASDPFIHYHVSVNPPVPTMAPTGPDTNTTYFQFTNGPASFFMLDTRRYRTLPERKTNTTWPHVKASESMTNRSPSILGQPQLEALLKYLRTPEPPHVQWKIIASSVPFTKNWRFGTSDTWGGFLEERAKVLAAMHHAEHNVRVRVIVLSGDRHEFAAIRYPPLLDANDKDGKAVYDSASQAGPHEFSVGPLSMFYLPFRTFKQIDDEDVAIAYLPDGNSKLGVVSISPMIQQQSALKYSLWVDGKVKWEYTLTSPGPGYKATRSSLGSGFWL